MDSTPAPPPDPATTPPRDPSLYEGELIDGLPIAFASTGTTTTTTTVTATTSTATVVATTNTLAAANLTTMFIPRECMAQRGWWGWVREAGSGSMRAAAPHACVHARACSIAHRPAPRPPLPLSSRAVAGVVDSCLNGNCVTACPGLSPPPLNRSELRKIAFQDVSGANPFSVGSMFNRCSYQKSRLNTLNSNVTDIVKLPCSGYK